MRQSAIAAEKRQAEEAAAALAEEAAELKRARIANGVEPGYQNGAPFEKPKKTRRSRKLKLFVWEGVLTDYTDGVIFALARDVQHARELVCAKEGINPKTGKSLTNSEYTPRVWLDMKKEPQVVTKPEAFLVWGGG